MLVNLDEIRQHQGVRQQRGSLIAGIVGLVIGLAAFVIFAGPLIVGSGPPSPPPSDHGCPAQKADLAGKTITSVDQLPDHLDCANLRGAVLDGLDLTQISLEHADAEGASFRHADLSQADLDFADLKGAHFDHATLDQADIRQADAHGASFASAGFTQTDLRDSDFSDADLDLAGLDQADLTATDLRGASLWGAHSIEAYGSGTKVGFVQPGSAQLEWVFVVIALVYLLRGLIRVLNPHRRGFQSPVTGFPQLRRSLGKPFAPFVFAAFLVGLLGHIALARLQFADLWTGFLIPLIVAVAVMFVAMLLPRPSRRRVDDVPLILRQLAS